jgi:hypothetical protein
MRNDFMLPPFTLREVIGENKKPRPTKKWQGRMNHNHP